MFLRIENHCDLKSLVHHWEASQFTLKEQKETATHSSILAWKIPWIAEPGRLHSMGSVAKSQTRLSDSITISSKPS